MSLFLAQVNASENVEEASELMTKAMDWLQADGISVGLKIVGAIAIFILGRIVAAALRKSIKRIMTNRGVDPSLVGFISSLAYFAIIAFTVVAVVGQFGVQTASFVAIFGAAGFAVGMALQGTLANFASGVMLLLFRPFKTGDFIDAAGIKGSVKDIQIFSTTLATPDNVMITVPNGKLYGDIIKNFNGYDTRRVDMTMGIGYGSDINKAMEIIRGLLKNDSRILPDPEPVVAVAELADSSVNIVVRPWVKGADYWNVFFEFHKNCKEAFDASGIEIPFPQTVVHLQKLAEESKN